MLQTRNKIAEMKKVVRDQQQNLFIRPLKKSQANHDPTKILTFILSQNCQHCDLVYSKANTLEIEKTFRVRLDFAQQRIHFQNRKLLTNLLHSLQIDLVLVVLNHAFSFYLWNSLKIIASEVFDERDGIHLYPFNSLFLNSAFASENSPFLGRKMVYPIFV